MLTASFVGQKNYFCLTTFSTRWHVLQYRPKTSAILGIYLLRLRFIKFCDLWLSSLDDDDDDLPCSAWKGAISTLIFEKKFTGIDPNSHIEEGLGCPFPDPTPWHSGISRLLCHPQGLWSLHRQAVTFSAPVQIFQQHDALAGSKPTVIRTCAYLTPNFII